MAEDRERSFDEEDWNRPIMGSGARDTVLERRSTLSNDNGVVAPNAPPAIFTCSTYRGKFFTRGCRGKIEEIQIYCRVAGADRITLRYSPHPCLGPIGEVTITPLATWGWVGAVIEEMWNYDSIFIWITVCQAGTEWGYDIEDPNDGHFSGDLGVTWLDLIQRPYIRVVLTGETPGDVPVSGIINNIEIPYSSSTREDEIADIPANTETVVIDVHGIGYNDYIEAEVGGVAGGDNTFIRVYCDGVLAGQWSFNMLNIRGHTTATPTVSLPRFLADNVCNMLIHKRFEFRRRFEVRAFNALVITTVLVYAYPTLMQ